MCGFLRLINTDIASQVDFPHYIGIDRLRHEDNLAVYVSYREFPVSPKALGLAFI